MPTPHPPPPAIVRLGAKATHHLPTPSTEAISTLNDRALRRLLGARAFLRGYDYVRRHAVDKVEIEDASAKGQVRGSDPEPYAVTVQLTPTGITSQCTCPAFSKINGHCKHVAALLIAVRDQFRPPRPPQPQPSQPQALPSVTSGPNGVSAYALPVPDGGGGGGRRGRRARARAMRQAQMNAHGMIARQGSEGKHGIETWLADAMPPQPKIEYRVEARQTSLAVRVIDPDARTPLLPSALLVPQSQSPTGDREALRLLARLETEQPRRVGIEVRGEDACDLLEALRGRRVILEPQMMELRWSEEPLKANFELELSQDGQSVLVKSFFTRAGDPRKFTTSQGAWFDGSPGWHVDHEGFARPIDRRVSTREPPEADPTARHP